MTYESSSSSILACADVLVVGGTLAGCMRAVAYAQQGRRVVLTTRGTSLPHEIVVCRRPWMSRDQIARMSEPFRSAVEMSIEHDLSGDQVLLNLTQLSVAVEDVLLDGGIELFYGLESCDVRTNDSGQLAAVRFGGKFGPVEIEASHFIDATPTYAIARFAKARHAWQSHCHVAVQLTAKVAINDRPAGMPVDSPQSVQACPETWPDVTSLDVPDCEVVRQGRVQLHGPYACFDLKLPFDATSRFPLQRLSVSARRSLVDIGSRINRQRIAAGLPELYFHRFGGDAVTEQLTYVKEWPANVEAAEMDFLEPVSSSTSWQLDENTTSCTRPRCGDVDAVYDVVIAGGGTSGVPAALAAAQHGARVLLIEQQADVGGTQTVGGVGNYWFGRQTPYQTACDNAYQTVTKQSGMAREVAMMASLAEAGVTVIAPASIMGVEMNGQMVEGIVIASEMGRDIVRGRTFIDATGDADVAAWAGVPHEFGNGRDPWTIWASFANFNATKRTASRHYESSVDVTEPRDFRRGVVTGRRQQGLWRRFKHDMPQHYLAPRETRRIQGKARVTYGGILAGQRFADVMTVCLSNFDIKGIASSDLLNSGVVWSWKTKDTFHAAIPWRAICPVGVANLLVVGRSYSVSHDAQSLARMQRDMVSLGAGAGCAAAHASMTNTPLNDLDVSTLQKLWVKQGSLREDDLATFGGTWCPDSSDIRQCMQALIANPQDPVAMARLAMNANALDAIRETFTKAQQLSVRTSLARLMCLHGDSTGVDFLIHQIQDEIRETLPVSQSPTLRPPPEHGWAPQPCYSLHAIALTDQGGKAAHVMLRLATMIQDDAAKFESPTHSPFEYVRAICNVADRHPGKEMLVVLDALDEKSCLRDLSIVLERDPRKTNIPMHENRAYLELCIARSLARSGDRRGFEILIRYISDARAVLARCALEEISDLLEIEVSRGEVDIAREVERHLAPGAVRKPLRRRID